MIILTATALAAALEPELAYHSLKRLFVQNTLYLSVVTTVKPIRFTSV